MLSLAGEEPLHALGRGVSVLQPDRPGVAHEVGLTALQLWQSLSESSCRGLGEDYLGVDVNIGARVGAAPGAGRVLVSDATCERLDEQRVRPGRGKKLTAGGAPRELRVHAIARAED